MPSRHLSPPASVPPERRIDKSGVSYMGRDSCLSSISLLTQDSKDNAWLVQNKPDPKAQTLLVGAKRSHLEQLPTAKFEGRVYISSCEFQQSTHPMVHNFKSSVYPHSINVA